MQLFITRCSKNVIIRQQEFLEYLSPIDYDKIKDRCNDERTLSNRSAHPSARERLVVRNIRDESSPDKVSRQATVGTGSGNEREYKQQIVGS